MPLRRRTSREVDLFLREAERRGACLESIPGPLHAALERRVATGELVSPLPHLYARSAAWSDLSEAERALHELRGLHELHPDWVFCGISAAVAHGLCVSNHLLGHVHIVSGSGSAARCLPHIRRHLVRNDAFERASGLPVTSLPRTVFDCLRATTFRDGLAIADSALRVGGLDATELVAYVDSLDTGFRGAAQARMTARHADARSQSGGESIARAAMHELGFARPELQVPFSDPMSPERTHYVDFCWRRPDASLVLGELDGGEKYLSPQMTGGRGAVWAMRRERRRESRLTATRAGIVRFSLEDVQDAAYFSRLLDLYGVPRDHAPLFEPDAVATAPDIELVPVEAYGL